MEVSQIPTKIRSTKLSKKPLNKTNRLNYLWHTEKNKEPLPSGKERLEVDSLPENKNLRKRPELRP